MSSQDGTDSVPTTLSGFLTAYVAAPMRSAGFKKVRSGTWMITSAERGVVLVQLRGRKTSIPEFFVEWAAIPPAMRDYRSGYDDTIIPKVNWGLITPRYSPPSKIHFNEHGSWEPDLTRGPGGHRFLEPGQMDAFGKHFASRLTDDAIPRWLAALDRTHIESLTASGDANFRGYGGKYLTRLFLHIDDGDPAELRALIAQQAAPMVDIPRMTAYELAHANERKALNDAKVLGFLTNRLDQRTATR